MSNGREAFLAQANVSRETTARLDSYAALVEKWSRRINLVGPSTIDQIWTRHFADSAQLLDLVAENFDTWADFGSGAGFPGAVIAIIAAENANAGNFVLVESDQRKAAFLRALGREVDLPLTVVARRIEETEPLSADIVSARALAPLSILLGYANRHLAPGGAAMFLKGARHVEELAEARKTWSFRVEIVRSMTDREAAILKIGDIERA